MNQISIIAPAKINLFLEVHNIKDDGYHHIESVMQTVSLCDTLDIERTDGEITLTGAEEKLSCGPNNLIIKAADAFFTEIGRDGGASFHLTKLIPIAAGLGGGSTDAAATLIGLNILFETGFSIKRLCTIGSKIGADIPFCIKRGTCYASGIGEMLKRCPDIPDCHIVIAIGKGRISTRWAFHRIDDVCGRRITAIDGMKSAIENKNINEIASNLYNAFEDVSPFEQQIKKILLENGALGAAMSGSGPAIYGIFSDKERANVANNALKKAGYDSYTCSPMNKDAAGRRI